MRPKWRALRVPERERGGTDQEIRERNHDAALLLLGVQLARKLRDVCRQRMNGHRGKEFFDEGLAPRPPFGRISTVDTVNEFDDTNGR
jgi:hypothetical protein